MSALASLNRFIVASIKLLRTRAVERFVSAADSRLDTFHQRVPVFPSTAAHEVPQAAGGNPPAERAPQPERRARQAAGAGD